MFHSFIRKIILALAFTNFYILRSSICSFFEYVYRAVFTYCKKLMFKLLKETKTKICTKMPIDATQNLLFWTKF
jgi:hypothetical protein